MVKNLFFSSNELEQRVNKWLELIRKEKPNSYACNVPMKLIACDGEHQELVFRFDVSPEMENPWGVTHGGMLALAMDWAMGITARTVLDRNDSPTINMNIGYLRPVPLGSELLIRAQVLHGGSTVATLRATAYISGDDRPCVSAEGVYFMRSEPLILNRT